MQSAFFPTGGPVSLQPVVVDPDDLAGATSRTASAPMRSSAQVSEATTQSSPIRPSVSGRKPSRSRKATRTPRRARVTEYAPSSRRIALATASGSGAGSRATSAAITSESEPDVSRHAVVEQLGAQLLDVHEVAVVAESTVRARP